MLDWSEKIYFFSFKKDIVYGFDISFTSLQFIQFCDMRLDLNINLLSFNPE